MNRTDILGGVAEMLASVRAWTISAVWSGDRLAVQVLAQDGSLDRVIAVHPGAAVRTLPEHEVGSHLYTRREVVLDYDGVAVDVYEVKVRRVEQDAVGVSS